LAPLLAGLHLALERDQGELVHTSRLFLVDGQGALVASYDSTDDAALDQLASRARQLLGVAEPRGIESAVSGMGAQLFLDLGCAGCHSDAQLAPPLGGLAGSHVMLERAGSVLANDAYLTESIAAPDSKLVAGYPSSMPNYGALLTPEQLRSLVAYLHSLAAPLGGDGANASAQVDPVCGMSVRVTSQTPSAEYQGKAYHFCSPTCAQRFKSDPRKYVGGPRAASP
jgi:YHS domain-containing protein/mono/diheme cytochrome c family protein